MVEVTLYLIWAVATAAIGSGFQHGYNIGVLNTPEEVIKDWMVSDGGFEPRNDSEEHKEEDIVWVWSMIVSTFCIGGMIGGALTGFLANKLGRRWALILNNIFAIIAGLFFGSSKMIGTFYFLFLGRFFIGVNAGLNAGLAPLYICEISPTAIRGATGSMYQLSITITIFIANMLGHQQVLGTESGWPILVALVIVVAVYQIIGMIFCPETPKYLVEKGRNDEAKKVTEKLGGKDSDVQFAETVKDVEDAKGLPTVTVKEMIQQKKLRKPLIIICFLMFAQQLSGINAVMFYSTAIFVMSKSSLETSQLNSVGVMALNVLTTVLSVYLVERFGRKLLLLLAFGGMIITTAILCGSLYYVEEKEAARYVAIIMVYAYVFFFAVGAGSIPWLLGPELFNTASRPLACSIAVPTNWIFNFIVGIGFRPLQMEMGPAVFSIFLICQIITVVVVWFFVPETKNKPIDEITALFE
ncbi:solute carrier family 2, facilitated glucose transporter member 3 [Halyomorpha halys]|uniref:solute carrier family 2, facilitated glucose transporter member 3 n=1 Tax=Halyomorpha halys TaxID=286706 RepID=UPI0006D4CBEE|nr:solute carrier family 2, facilitated glucose transporter member 3-like [Halyomorpha halys]